MAHESSSKTALIELRIQRGLMRDGMLILEERRDLLAHLLMQQIGIVGSLVEEGQRLSERARAHVRGAILRHGAAGVAAFARAPVGDPGPYWSVESRLGTPWLEAVNPTTSFTDRRPQGGWQISVELELATASLQAFLRHLTTLAAAENNLRRLVGVFRRTQRRVNALEHVLLPEIDADIRRMEDVMDEMERDDLARSILVKRRKALD